MQKYEFKNRPTSATKKWCSIQLIEKFKNLCPKIPTSLITNHIPNFCNSSRLSDESLNSFSPSILPKSEALAQKQLTKFFPNSLNISIAKIENSSPRDELILLAESENHLVADEKKFAVGEKWQHNDFFMGNGWITTKSNAPTTLPPSKFCVSADNSASHKKLQINTSTVESVDARIQLLYEKHKQTMEKVEKKRNLEKRDELKDCTFKPQIISTPTKKLNYTSSLASLSNKSQKNLNFEKSSLQKDLEACTFQPKINQKYSATSKNYPMKFKDSIKNRRDSFLKKLDLESIIEAEASQEINIDINIRPGINKELKISKGKNINKVINEFARKNNLTTFESKLLKEMVNKKTQANC